MALLVCVFMFPLELMYLLLWNINMQDHHMLLQSIKISKVGFGNLLTYCTVSAYFISNIPTISHHGKSADVSLKPGIICFTKTLIAWSCCRAARWKKSKEPENAPGLAGFSQNSTFQNSQKLARILLLILPQNSSFLNLRRAWNVQKNTQLGILCLIWRFSREFWKLTTYQHCS